MFKDESLESVNIVSSIKAAKYVRDDFCQTSAIKESDIGCQSVSFKDAQVQTENVDILPNATKLRIDNSKALNDFLIRIYPDVSDQLIANTRSHAFDDYCVNWELEANEISCLHLLQHEDLVKEEVQITSVTWNCVGSTLAISYGHQDHENWCVHKGSVSLWNIDRRKLDPKKADRVLDTSCCLMDVCFHHSVPPLLAGGDFSGIVYIWDLSKEGEVLMATSGKEIDGHQEPVSKVLWIKEAGGSRRKHKLMSVSFDGKALVWEYNEMSRELALANGYLLLAGNSRNNPFRSGSEIGVSCVTFSKHDEDTFFLGSESGGVFKCSLSSGVAILQGQTSKLSFRSPVTLSYEPHSAPVYALDTSPFHRNVFLTASMDSTIRIYNMLQVRPVMILESGSGYIFSAQWSPTRPLVLCASTSHGEIVVYDLKRSRVAPIKTMKSSESQASINALQYNPTRRQLVAAGDAKGHVQVWSLSSDVTAEQADDVALLSRLAEEVLE